MYVLDESSVKKLIFFVGATFQSPVFLQIAFLSPFGGITRKKALDFGKGVGKKVLFPWRKATRSKTECWKPWVFKEQIPFATAERGLS